LEILSPEGDPPEEREIQTYTHTQRERETVPFGKTYLNSGGRGDCAPSMLNSSSKEEKIKLKILKKKTTHKTF